MEIERPKTENERKYMEALEKQKQQMKQSSSILKIKNDNQEFLDKDKTMVQIIKEIDTYCIAYNIPNMVIINNDWDSFFDILYELFLEKGLEDRFYNSISEVVRFTLAKGLINKTNEINITDFVDNLYYLQNWQINEKEILILQKKIMLEIQASKVINFSDFTDEKTRKK